MHVAYVALVSTPLCNHCGAEIKNCDAHLSYAGPGLPYARSSSHVLMPYFMVAVNRVAMPKLLTSAGV